jgi:hypothetical protein
MSAAAPDRPARPPSRLWTVASRASLLAVGALIAVALVVVGTPGAERARRLDEQRIGNLQRISTLVDGFYAQKHVLPASMAQLTRESTEGPPPVDPGSGRPYEYRPEGPLAYTLCATFETTMPEEPRGFWWHPAGRQCFSLETRKQE